MPFVKKKMSLLSLLAYKTKQMVANKIVRKRKRYTVEEECIFCGVGLQLVIPEVYDSNNRHFLCPRCGIEYKRRIYG